MCKESMLKELIDNVLNITMEQFTSDEMYIDTKNMIRLKLVEFITSENTRNLLYKLAEEKMLQFEKEDKTLKELLPSGFENSLKVLVYNKGPEITKAVREFINNDKFKHTIRVEISKFVAGMGPMVSKFVNADNIYNRIMMSIFSYVQSPETMMNIVTGINSKIDTLSEDRLSDFSNSIPYQGKLSFIKAIVDSCVTSLTHEDFINSMGHKLDEELIKFKTLREFLLSIGITEERLLGKFALTSNPSE